MTHELPTEPGYYLDADGFAFNLGEDGSWEDHRFCENRFYPSGQKGDAPDEPPFTRLVPLSVEDRTLITDVLNMWPEGRTPMLAGDVLALQSRLRALAARVAPDQNGQGA